MAESTGWGDVFAAILVAILIALVVLWGYHALETQCSLAADLYKRPTRLHLGLCQIQIEGSWEQLNNWLQR